MGFVSDERYVAVPDVLLEWQRDAELPVVVRSTARGGVYADLPPGEYRVTLAKPGFGSKRVPVRLGDGPPHQFRLLRDGLLGYVWPKWARAGERGEFRVHAVEPYRLSLWRYGLRKEEVRLLGWFDEHGPGATMQITPDGDYTRDGVGWNRVGYSSPHHTQLATAPERSGLYYFHAETENGDFFSFPWVVAPAAPSAPVAVLASTNTWNAYNSFGGRSNYVNATGLPPEPTVNARQDLVRYGGGSFNEWQFPDEAYAPLSFDRPEPCNHVPRDCEVTDPIRGRSGCHLAPAEWRLLGWLELEGFGYDYYSESQLHDGTLDLDAYRVLILSVHPEYWSRRMYTRVKEWVFERGGRLLYLGGNGLNCEVELEGDTMRCRSQLVSGGGALSMADPDDPSRVWESRLHRTLESEASLLGVVCTDAGIMTAAPYRVTDASHWSYDGTGLQNGDLFGERSLHERCHGGASGHETDKRSPHSPPGTRLLARGLNPEEGGAEIVYHEPGEGAVFSVGSITYVASLLVDPAVSRLTRNVLNRFIG
ncbi:MAG: N,N-dimethylformamidase beta subunit family domain-containing protein [Armatimonadota bacterium]